MTLYAIDASVAAKWYFPESFQTSARRYLAPQFQHIAPNLLRIEFAGILHKKEKNGDIDAFRSDSFLQHFLQNAQITYFSSQGLLTNAHSIARNIQHSIYDCLYLALAERESAVVVTADSNFCASPKQRHDFLSTSTQFFPVP